MLEASLSSALSEGTIYRQIAGRKVRLWICREFSWVISWPYILYVTIESVHTYAIALSVYDRRMMHKIICPSRKIVDPVTETRPRARGRPLVRANILGVLELLIDGYTYTILTNFPVKISVTDVIPYASGTTAKCTADEIYSQLYTKWCWRKFDGICSKCYTPR